MATSFANPEMQEYGRAQAATLRAQAVKRELLAAGASEQEAQTAATQSYESEMNGAARPTGAPLSYNPQSSTPQYTPQNITNVDTPEEASRQDRIYAYGRGEDLDRGYRDDLSSANRALAGYTDATNALYEPLSRGQGGVRGDELDRIVREGELRGLDMTPEEMAAAGLSDEERENILGDPNSRRKWFNPNLEGQIFDETQGFRRGAVSDYGRDLRGAYDPNTLRAPSGYYGALADSRDAFAANSRAALDPSGLTVSDQFLSDYQLTPEQQQDMVTSAAATVGTRDKAAIGELERRARAAGTNPLGVAAFRQRTERESSANAADAALRAKIAASETAAERMRTGEDMRLRYGQNLANMRTGVERDIADTGFRTAQAAEGTRAGVERDIADRNTNVADRAGMLRYGNETDLGRERLALQQSVSQRGNETERDVDDAYTQRLRDIALNRQGTQQYLAGQRYNRGVATNDRLADRYRYGADTRRDDEREARAYYTGQVTQANQNAQRGQDRRLQLYGAQTGAGQDATRTQGQLYEARKNRPSTLDKLLGTGLGVASAFFGGGRAKGGMITEPTIAMLGEEGPEMVVPLNGEPNAVVPPRFAFRYGKPMPFNTAPEPVRPKAAYSQQYRYA